VSTLRELGERLKGLGGRFAERQAKGDQREADQRDRQTGKRQKKRLDE